MLNPIERGVQPSRLNFANAEGAECRLERFTVAESAAVRHSDMRPLVARCTLMDLRVPALADSSV